MITVFKPYISQKAKEYALDVLNGTQIAEGEWVKRFEQAFADYIGVDASRVVAVNSGTSALELAYELAGVKQGHQVVTPVLTCTATNLPILHRGATPVFCDINDDLVVDAQDMELRINGSTHALVYVHFGGFNGTLNQVQELGEKYMIPVIEDAAQCVGASTSSWGTSDYVAVSLQAIKTLTAGDGGFLICKDPEKALVARRLRWFGYDRDLKQKQGDTDLTEAGYKYHMNNINAAIGLGNLESLQEALDSREAVAQVYRDSGLPILMRPWLAIMKDSAPNILKIKSYLATKGIVSSPYHYRNDKYTIFGGLRTDLPLMDELEHCYTLLPFHQGMTTEDADTVVKFVKDALK